MKLGFNLLLWTAHMTEDIYPRCARLQKAGYDGVEVPVFAGDADFYRDVGERLSDLGLKRTVVAIVQDEARNPMSHDAAHRAAGLDHLKELVDCAAALGAEVLAGPFYQPLGVFSGRGPTEDEWQALVMSQTVMATYAHAAGVTLAVEPLNRFECYALNTCGDAARLVDAVATPGYGYLFDTFHSNIEEADPVAALTETLARVTHVHISENHRGTPGRGHIDFVPVIAALKAGGYDGWLTIEAFGHALPDIAAATKVWRPLFTSEDQVWQEGLATLRRALASA